MKVLVHGCCGPCLVMPLTRLGEEGAKASVFFYNPNVHPYLEWKKRLETLAEHCERTGTGLLPVGDYGAVEWFRAVAYRESKRCSLCYRLRLFEAAKIAKKGKFDSFTTSLLYSKYQNHDLVRSTGEEVAEEVGIPFLYRDWRPDWDEGVAKSRELGMYRQGYCGCIFSEIERFAPKVKSPSKRAGSDG